MKPNELERLLQGISSSISSVVKATSLLGDIDAQVEYQDNPEDRFLHIEFTKILEQLQSAEADINYLSRPIISEGVLRMNHLGYYVLIAENGEEVCEYTSGERIEALMYDSNDDTSYWVKSRIESEAGRYFLYGFKRIESLEGLRARVRG